VLVMSLRGENLDAFQGTKERSRPCPEKGTVQRNVRVVFMRGPPPLPIVRENFHPVIAPIKSRLFYHYEDNGGVT